MMTEEQRLNGKNFDKYNEGISNWKWVMRESVTDACCNTREKQAERAHEDRDANTTKAAPKYSIRSAHGAVFWYLLFHANQKTKLVHTSNDKLAEYTWQSRRTVQKVMSDFKRWGIIEKINKHDIPGQWTTYELIVKHKY